MRKIGILTGGGDCPGLNAVIRGVVEKCAEAGMEVFGFRDGWRGLAYAWVEAWYVRQKFLRLWLRQRDGTRR